MRKWRKLNRKLLDGKPSPTFHHERNWARIRTRVLQYASGDYSEDGIFNAIDAIRADACYDDLRYTAQRLYELRTTRHSVHYERDETRANRVSELVRLVQSYKDGYTLDSAIARSMIWMLQQYADPENAESEYKRLIERPYELDGYSWVYEREETSTEVLETESSTPVPTTQACTNCAEADASTSVPCKDCGRAIDLCEECAEWSRLDGDQCMDCADELRADNNARGR